MLAASDELVFMFLISADIWDLKQILLRLWLRSIYETVILLMQWRKILFLQAELDIRISPQIQPRLLRAVEIEAEAILLAKAVDGIYDSDPKVNPRQ